MIYLEQLTVEAFTNRNLQLFSETGITIVIQFIYNEVKSEVLCHLPKATANSYSMALAVITSEPMYRPLQHNYLKVTTAANEAR